MKPHRLEPGFCTESEHGLKVAKISSQLRAHTSERPLAIRKKSVSHEVPRAVDSKYTDEPLDLSDLDRILEINTEERTCTAESGVTFIDLVRAALPHGLVPFVVPELKTITIGGAVAGCSIESMSYKYGGFHDSCLEYEVVTANGEILTCSESENQLLFQMTHGTFGTLGILTKLKFKLTPAKPFVRLKYEKYKTLDDYTAAIWKHYKDRDIDFMDGIIHSPNLYVLSAGQFTGEAPYTGNYNWTAVYYQSTASREEDYLTTEDYFFRYDRGVTNVHPKSWLGRFLLGRFFGSEQLLGFASKIHRFLPAKKPAVTVDVFIPFSRIKEFMEWYRLEFDFFPLWVVPYKRVRDYEWISPEVFKKNPGEELFIDLAIYGMEQKGEKNYYRAMEEELMKIGALKTLISYNYYSEEEFWKTWNHDNYSVLKQKTDPHNIFRDLYTKTCRRDL